VRFARVRDLPALAAPGPAARSSSPPVVEVLDGGLLTTVQDLGRFGHRRQGVPWAGAMDAPALRAANLAVATPRRGGLECAVAGPVLRVLAPVRWR
jgi:allophanate hydrolase subunit 2